MKVTKLEAILHLYTRKLISEEKAYRLAESRNLTEEEKAELKEKIELIKNPPVTEIDETPETTTTEGGE